MAKQTQPTQPTNNDQSFAYAVGQDIAALKTAVENLTHNQQGEQSQLLKVVIPGILGKSIEHFIPVEVPLPEEFRNSICIEYFEADGGSSVSFFTTEKTLPKSINDVEQVYYIKKLIGIYNCIFICIEQKNQSMQIKMPFYANKNASLQRR